MCLNLHPATLLFKPPSPQALLHVQVFCESEITLSNGQDHRHLELLRVQGICKNSFDETSLSTVHNNLTSAETMIIQ